MSARPAHRAPGSRRAPRRRRWSVIPNPAVIGVSALAIAGMGIVLQPDAGDQTVTSEGAPTRYITLDAPEAGTPTIGRLNSMAVSRSIPESVRREQAALQAEQRREALRELAASTQDRTDELIAEERAEQRAEARERREALSVEQEAEGLDPDALGDTEVTAGQWVLPVAGYSITATYGQAGSYWSSGYHTGLDFAAGTGTPLVAVSSGTVTSTGYDGAYGNKTVLTLDDGTQVWYAHQNTIDVSAGESVSPGQVIGTVGSTGNVTGPHLHLETYVGGSRTDPYAELAAHGVTP